MYEYDLKKNEQTMDQQPNVAYEVYQVVEDQLHADAAKDLR